MTEAVAKNLLTKNAKIIIPYIIAVVCTTAFFVHEFIPTKSKELYEKEQEYILKRDQRTLALTAVKKYAEKSSEYTNYKKIAKEADLAFNELKKIKESEKFIGFKNTNNFLGEFGWALGLCIYSLFNLFRTYATAKKDVGYIFLHTTILGIGLFYMCWIFQPFQDFSKSLYSLSAILTAITVSYSVYLMSKYNFSDIGKLKLIIKNLFDFILVESEEKDFIKEESKEIYQKRILKLTKETIDNE